MKCFKEWHGKKLKKTGGKYVHLKIQNQQLPIVNHF